MGWIKNTAGRPDSQFTLLLGWNILTALLVVYVVVRGSMGTPVAVDSEVWAVCVGMAVGKGYNYVKRRGQAAADAPLPGEDLAG